MDCLARVPKDNSLNRSMPSFPRIWSAIFLAWPRDYGNHRVSLHPELAKETVADPSVVSVSRNFISLVYWMVASTNSCHLSRATAGTIPWKPLARGLVSI